MIVDLETHRILDLLPDRTTTTVEAWLQAHPGIRNLGRYLTQWRTEPGRKGRPPKVPAVTPTVLPRRQRPLSARRLRWLCCTDPAEHTLTDNAFLASL